MWNVRCEEVFTYLGGEQRDTFDVCSLRHSTEGKEKGRRRRGVGGGEVETGAVDVAAARKCLRRWKWRAEGRVRRVLFVALERKERRREEGAEVSEVVNVMRASVARKYLRIWRRRAEERVRCVFFVALERRKGGVKET